MQFNESEQLYKRAEQVIPGGVNSPVRAFKSVNAPSIFAQKAQGAHITDADGQTFLDYIMSWGPLILGHAREEVLDGVEETIRRGTSFGLSTELEIQLAELIRSCYPAAEMVRMVNSGTEATMSAIRLAKGYTKRRKIVKFEGCYHGHYDGLLVKSGSGAKTYHVPTSEGVSAEVGGETLVVPYNDVEALKTVFQEYGDEIAGVIVEPVAGNMGVIGAAKDFLQKMRHLTEKNGSLLIFDEVITGFRLGLGGAAEYYGIEPDLACFGKIIGGGMPVGAYAGKKEIMKKVSPLGGVYQGGTLSGNPVSMKLGLNTITYLKEHPETYDALEKKAQMLEEEWTNSARRKGVPIAVNRVRGMMSVFMTDGKVKESKDVDRCEEKRYEHLFKGMLKEGILFPPSQYEGLFLSDAHTMEDVEKTIRAFEKVVL